MNIDYISDIHIDFYISPEYNKEEFLIRFERIQSIIYPLNFNLSKVLCILGDVSHYVYQIEWILEYYSNIYDYVLYVHGNHEMYCLSGEVSYVDKLNELKEKLNKIDKVFYLDGEIIEIDGILFGGTSMWYDFSYGIKNHNKSLEEMKLLWKMYLKDSQRIRDGFTKDYYIDKSGKIININFDSVEYFKKEYDKLLLMKKCKVILSHVMPFIPNNYPKEYLIPETGFFSFDGESFISDSSVEYWISGHTHKKVIAKKFGVKLFINPYGYPNENWDKKMRQFTIK